MQTSSNLVVDSKTNIFQMLGVGAILALILFIGVIFMHKEVWSLNEGARIIVHDIQLELDYYYKDNGEYPQSYDDFDYSRFITRRDFRNQIVKISPNEIKFRSASITYQASDSLDGYEIEAEQRFREPYRGRNL